MTALTMAWTVLVRLLGHPVVQSALKKAIIAGGREVIRHATSPRTSEHVNRKRVNRA